MVNFILVIVFRFFWKMIDKPAINFIGCKWYNVYVQKQECLSHTFDMITLRGRGRGPHHRYKSSRFKSLSLGALIGYRVYLPDEISPFIFNLGLGFFVFLYSYWFSFLFLRLFRIRKIFSLLGNGGTIALLDYRLCLFSYMSFFLSRMMSPVWVPRKFWWSFSFFQNLKFSDIDWIFGRRNAVRSSLETACSGCEMQTHGSSFSCDKTMVTNHGKCYTCDFTVVGLIRVPFSLSNAGSTHKFSFWNVFISSKIIIV